MTDLPKVNGDFYGKNIISLDQFAASDLTLLFKHTQIHKKIADYNRPSKRLAGHIISLLFYEPSSRTFGSFLSAAQRLGAGTLAIQNPETVSSVAKGETLEDTIRTFASYTSAIVIRSKKEGTAQEAANATDIPIINAGDGTGEHPTQALLDMYTLFDRFGTLSGLTGVIVGDLLNGRTVHSLLRGLSLFKNNHIYLLSPQNLQLPTPLLKHLQTKGLTIHILTSTKNMPINAHFWYWTRVQKERFVHLEEYEKLKHSFILTPQLLKDKGNPNLILMHPLPRVGEIEEGVDNDPRAYYFKQMRNGLYVRMALFDLILNKR